MESKSKSKAAPKQEALATVPTPATYNWMVKKVDPDTAEEYDAPKYKYIPGNPRDYRTDMGTAGTIKINGLKEVPVPFTIQPIAARGFTANLFDMGEKDWLELAFVDSQNCVSMILFHGFSYEAFMENIATALEYDEVKISDVLLTINLDEKKNEKLKAIYHIASFTYEIAPDQAHTKELKAYAREHKIFRKATVKEDQVLHFSHMMHNPLEAEASKELSE
jgi:hypothetical protein